MSIKKEYLLLGGLVGGMLLTSKTKCSSEDVLDFGIKCLDSYSRKTRTRKASEKK